MDRKPKNIFKRSETQSKVHHDRKAFWESVRRVPQDGASSLCGGLSTDTYTSKMCSCSLAALLFGKRKKVDTNLNFLADLANLKDPLTRVLKHTRSKSVY